MQCPFSKRRTQVKQTRYDAAQHKYAEEHAKLCCDYDTRHHPRLECATDEDPHTHNELRGRVGLVCTGATGKLGRVGTLAQPPPRMFVMLLLQVCLLRQKDTPITWLCFVT